MILFVAGDYYQPQGQISIKTIDSAVIFCYDIDSAVIRSANILFSS